jgi:hypothetical protein
MAVSFFLTRVLMMGYIAFHFFYVLRDQFFALPPSTYGVILLSYCFGYPLQLFWFYKIAKGIIKLLFGGKKSDEKKA